jgi:hypothetical protein
MFTHSSDELMDQLLAERRASNIRTIMQSLKPHTP